jgi:hypothetical protein
LSILPPASGFDAKARQDSDIKVRKGSELRH